MTDKEKAEERATKFADINFNEPDTYGCDKEIGHFSYAAGFLAGLNTGRPAWHDLRKDKNDLPDILCYVWTNVGAGYYDGDHWRDEFGRLRNVVAWCEPKFEED